MVEIIMATNDVHIREAIGIINGINVDFTTPEDYISGTIHLIMNGVLIKRDDDDSIIETGSNSFRMKIPPVTNDVIHVRYKEA